MSKDEGPDYSKFAFVLKKSVFERSSYSGSVKSSSEIDITNLYLRDLLKKHLSHYPSHTFRDLPVTLNSPFEPIVLYFDGLRKVAETEVEGETDDDMKAREDLLLLLDIISGGSTGDEKLDKYFKMRTWYKSQTPETIQFDDLWTVFKPGMLVYGSPYLGAHQVFLVKGNSAPWPTYEQRGGNLTAMPWELEAWS